MSSHLHAPLTVDGRLCVSAGRDGSIGVADVAANKTWQMKMPSRGGLFSRPSEAWPTEAGTPTGLPLARCSVDVTRRSVMITSAGADGTVRGKAVFVLDAFDAPALCTCATRTICIIFLKSRAYPSACVARYCRSGYGTYALAPLLWHSRRDGPCGASNLFPPTALGFQRSTLTVTCCHRLHLSVTTCWSAATRTGSCASGTRVGPLHPWLSGMATRAPRSRP
jgi:hypothetical protein